MADVLIHAIDLTTLAQSKAFEVWWAAGGIGAAALLYANIDSASRILALDLKKSPNFAAWTKDISLVLVLVLTVAICTFVLGWWFFPDLSLLFDIGVALKTTLAFLFVGAIVSTIYRKIREKRVAQARPPLRLWTMFILGLVWRIAALTALYVHIGKFLFAYLKTSS